MIIMPIIIMQGTEGCRAYIADVLSTDLHAKLPIRIFLSYYNLQSEKLAYNFYIIRVCV
jgi:hypothetical protein